MPGEDLVHGRCHVFEAPAGDHLDGGIGEAGDQARDFVERREAAGQLEEHERRTGEKVLAERTRAVPVSEPPVGGIAEEGGLTREGILVHPDAGGPEERRSAESEGAISVLDHHKPFAGKAGRGLVEDQPVTGVDSEEIGGLDVGETPERGEIKLSRASHAVSGRQAGAR